MSGQAHYFRESTSDHTGKQVLTKRKKRDGEIELKSSREFGSSVCERDTSRTLLKMYIILSGTENEKY